MVSVTKGRGLKSLYIYSKNILNGFFVIFTYYFIRDVLLLG